MKNNNIKRKIPGTLKRQHSQSVSAKGARSKLVTNKRRRLTFLTKRTNRNLLGVNRRQAQTTASEIKRKLIFPNSKVLKVSKVPKTIPGSKDFEIPKVPNVPDQILNNLAKFPVVELVKITDMSGAQDAVTEEETESSSDYVDESSDDDSCGGSQSGASIRPGVDLDVGNTLRRILEQDFELITHKNKLAVLPAQPTVALILESWVQHFTDTELKSIPDKSQRSKGNNIMEKTLTEINICREVADGLRVYFDFTLYNLLLYRQEREQYNSLMATIVATEPTQIKEEPIEVPEVIVKEEIEDTEYAHLPPFQEEDQDLENSNKPMSQIKRKLRSCRVSSLDESRQLRSHEEAKQEQGNLSSSMASTSSRCSSPRGVTLRMPVIIPAHVNTLLQDSKAWRLLPESLRHDGTRNPCLYYGAVHFVRLFVKMPELLQNSDIADKKLKVVLKYLDMILSYLEMHREWFGEQFYTQAETQTMEQTENP